MPAGKELGTFDGKFSSIRVLENGDFTRVLEGTYQAVITGQLEGTAKGSMTFDGRSENGVFSDKGVGFLLAGKLSTPKVKVFIGLVIEEPGKPEVHLS